METTEQAGLAGFPADLPLPGEEAEIVKNYSVELSDSRVQRVVIYDSQQTVAALTEVYQNWYQGSEFSLQNEVVDQYGHKFVLTTEAGEEMEAERLVIAITHPNSRELTRVQLNYVSPQ